MPEETHLVQQGNNLVALKGAKPRVESYRELPSVTWADWKNVAMARMALVQLEQGVFDMAAQIVDSMGQDDRITGVMEVRVGALPGVPLTFDGQGDGRQKTMVAREAEKAFGIMFPDEDLRSLHHWGVMINAGLGELVWTKGGVTRWTPTLKLWHPRWLTWREDTQSYWVQTMSGQVEVEPGNGQWILFTPYGKQRSWMGGRVRSLLVPWLMRQWGARDWARASEVWGSPIRKAVTPVGASDEAKDKFLREVANIGNEVAIRTPKASDENRYDLELLEATMDFSAGFEKLMNKAETCISVAILGQNLTTEVTGGSYSAAQVHNYIRNDILRSDAKALAKCLREQGLVWWAQANFGNKDGAPEVKWHTDPAEDKKAKGDALRSIGEGLVALQMAGAKPDVDAICEEAGIPLTGPSEEPASDAGADPRADQTDDGDPNPGQDPAPEQSPGKNSMTLLAAIADDPQGAIDGQAYVDDLVNAATEDGRDLFAKDLALLLSMIESAESFDAIKAGLVDIHGKMNRKNLSALMAKALTMAELAGRNAVDEDM